MNAHTTLVLASYAADLAQQITVKPSQPPGAAGLLKIAGWVAWGVSLAGVLALIYAGGKFAWERWHGGAVEAPKIVIFTLIGAVIASFAGPIMQAVITS